MWREVGAQSCRNGVAEIVSIHCWQHGSDLYQLKSDWVTHLSVCVKHGISGFKMWWGFFVCATLCCFQSATLSNSHFSAGLSSLHGFVLISICQKATYFFSALANNSIGKKNHSIVIVYLHDIYHQCTVVVSQETSNAEPVLRRKYES